MQGGVGGYSSSPISSPQSASTCSSSVLPLEGSREPACLHPSRGPSSQLP